MSQEPQFFVVVELPEPSGSTHFELRLLNIENEFQQSLWREFCEQAAKFCRNKHAVNFDPGYLIAQRGEILVSRGFPLPQGFVDDIREPTHCERIGSNEVNERNVKAVVGAVEAEDGSVEKVIFKWLAGTKVIDQKTVMVVIRKDVLARSNDTALVIPEPVHAVYESGDLHFHAYDTVRKFLEIDAIYRDASREEVADFLRNSPLVFEGEDLYETADDWTRRRISLIMRNLIWEKRSIQQICGRAEQLLPMPIDVTDEGNSIKLPEDRGLLREVVRFLNQDICRTGITDETIVVGDKRPYSPNP